MTHIRLYQAPIRPDKTQLILSYQHTLISAKNVISGEPNAERSSREHLRREHLRDDRVGTL